jgi:hypothetical protein
VKDNSKYSSVNFIFWFEDKKTMDIAIDDLKKSAKASVGKLNLVSPKSAKILSRWLSL